MSSPVSQASSAVAVRNGSSCTAPALPPRTMVPWVRCAVASRLYETQRSALRHPTAWPGRRGSGFCRTPDRQIRRVRLGELGNESLVAEKLHEPALYTTEGLVQRPGHDPKRTLEL